MIAGITSTREQSELINAVYQDGLEVFARLEGGSPLNISIGNTYGRGQIYFKRKRYPDGLTNHPPFAAAPVFGSRSSAR